MGKGRQVTVVAQLFADHRDRLQAFLRRRLANESDAQELAQEAYLRMLRVKRINFVRNPQAYLYRVARNLVHELYTGQRLDIDGDVEVDRLESQHDSPLEAAARSHRQALVERALQELPIKCRVAVLLHWRDGLTQVEIAARTQLSRQMVQKYLATGLAHCQKRLRQIAREDRGEP